MFGDKCYQGAIQWPVCYPSPSYFIRPGFKAHHPHNFSRKVIFVTFLKAPIFPSSVNTELRVIHLRRTPVVDIRGQVVLELLNFIFFFLHTINWFLFVVPVSDWFNAELGFDVFDLGEYSCHV